LRSQPQEKRRPGNPDLLAFSAGGVRGGGAAGPVTRSARRDAAAARRSRDMSEKEDATKDGAVVVGIDGSPGAGKLCAGRWRRRVSARFHCVLCMPGRIAMRA